jgi:hypothetical protein
VPTPGVPPSAPIDVRVFAAGNDLANVLWKKVGGAESYDIQVNEEATGDSYGSIKNVSANAPSDQSVKGYDPNTEIGVSITGLRSSTGYNIRVVAINAHGVAASEPVYFYYNLY